MNGFPSELNPISGKRVAGGKGKVLLTRSDFRPFLSLFLLPCVFLANGSGSSSILFSAQKKAVGLPPLLKGTRWKEEEGWFVGSGQFREIEKRRDT